MIPIRDDAPRSTTPYVNYFVILLNTLVFLFELSLGSRSRDAFVFQFGFVPEHLNAWISGYLPADAALVPFFSSMFLHASWLHLIFNMWFLGIFGDNVEDHLGHFRYLLFYLLCGLGAEATHYAFNLNSRIPSVGASGAIAGVMGAYFVLFPHARVLTWAPFLLFLVLLLFPLAHLTLPLVVVIVFLIFLLFPGVNFFTIVRSLFFLWLPAWLVLGYWFIGQFLSGAATSVAYAHETSGGVAVWAHVGGFVAGVLLVKVFPARRQAYYSYEGY
jgi:membrane associated rhomboid family serine protease